jgi:hypothetical protein
MGVFFYERGSDHHIIISYDMVTRVVFVWFFFLLSVVSYNILLFLFFYFIKEC